MTRRRAAVDATRRRILEATMALHAEQGVFNTSWEDIAGRAGVSVGTVYRHFPSLDDLVPACGELSMARLALPTGEEIAAAFDGADGLRERVARLVSAAFDVYDRGWDVIVAVRRDPDGMEPLREARTAIEGWHEALVRAALDPLEASEREVRGTRALVDLDTWQALRRQGLDASTRRDVVADVLAAWLGRGRR